jgi:hypothetical protein
MTKNKRVIKELVGKSRMEQGREEGKKGRGGFSVVREF